MARQQRQQRPRSAGPAACRKLVALLDVATTRDGRRGALCDLACDNRDQPGRDPRGRRRAQARRAPRRARGAGERRGGAVASGPRQQRQPGRIREAGGVPKLVALLDVPRAGNAAGALRNWPATTAPTRTRSARPAACPSSSRSSTCPQARQRRRVGAVGNLADCYSVNQDAIVEQLCTARHRERAAHVRRRGRGPPRGDPAARRASASTRRAARTSRRRTTSCAR